MFESLAEGTGLEQEKKAEMMVMILMEMDAALNETLIKDIIEKEEIMLTQIYELQLEEMENELD